MSSERRRFLIAELGTKLYLSSDQYSMTVGSADAGYINVLKSIGVSGLVRSGLDDRDGDMGSVRSISSGTPSYGKLGSTHLYISMSIKCESGYLDYWPYGTSTNSRNYSPVIYVESLSGSTCYYRSISY